MNTELLKLLYNYFYNDFKPLKYNPDPQEYINRNFFNWSLDKEEYYIYKYNKDNTLQHKTYIAYQIREKEIIIRNQDNKIVNVPLADNSFIRQMALIEKYKEQLEYGLEIDQAMTAMYYIGIMQLLQTRRIDAIFFKNILAKYNENEEINRTDSYNIITYYLYQLAEFRLQRELPNFTQYIAVPNIIFDRIFLLLDNCIELIQEDHMINAISNLEVIVPIYQPHHQETYHTTIITAPNYEIKTSSYYEFKVTQIVAGKIRNTYTQKIMDYGEQDEINPHYNETAQLIGEIQQHQQDEEDEMEIELYGERATYERYINLIADKDTDQEDNF